MKLYQITLPLNDNEGRAYTRARFDEFEYRCLDFANGFTDCGEVIGQWRDQATLPVGKVYVDTSHVYQVACSDADWQAIVAHAKRLWADQVCLAVATLGDFELV